VEFLQPSALEAKESLREFNMLLAEKRYASGLRAFLHALHASPVYVWRRVRDELRKAAIGNGVEPNKFWKRKEVLWT
jgi:hypothetical protein